MVDFYGFSDKIGFMSVQTWENFFKPEVRSAGRAFVKQNKVTVSQLSDTEVQSYVRASTSFKIIFKSETVSSNTVKVDCSCPLSKKGQFCKHIWAALLVIEDKKPDFLDGKTELEKGTAANFESAATAKSKPQSQAHADSQAAYKQKQNDYRKEQYQKQKQRLKDIKNKEKGIIVDDSYPVPVESALKYFSENGFELRDSMNREAIGVATKKLARVFHPDVGGSHEEILELNKQAEVLTKFSKS